MHGKVPRCPVARVFAILAEDGSEDPDRGHGNNGQQQREAEDIAHALRLYTARSLGFVEMNLFPMPFHSRLLTVETWANGNGATAAFKNRWKVGWRGLA